MRTIRRLYFYAVAFISLEVVLWGLISLLRSIFDPGIIGGNATRLAGALALTLVGVPVFGLHWWVVQRDARREMDEHASGVRAFFLYAALLSTLIPIVQNFLVLRQPPVPGCQSPSRAWRQCSARQQNWSDNLIAMLMNALVASYFITVLRADWQVDHPKDLPDNRPPHLPLCMGGLFGLVMTVAGVQQLLLFVLHVPAAAHLAQLLRATFVNGLTLTLVGTPLWYLCLENGPGFASAEPAGDAASSLLRLGLLYALSLAGVITVLILERDRALPGFAAGPGRGDGGAGLCPTDQRTAFDRHPPGGGVGLLR